VRDAGHLAFNELSKEWELLFIGHDVWGATNLPLCDEHFQMGHDLVFQLLVLPDRNESDHTQTHIRARAMKGRKRGVVGEKGEASFSERNGSETNLKPFVELDMILVCLSIVVLASSRLSPKTFCELEGTGDRVVKNAIVFARLTGEGDGEHAGLNAQLEDTTAVRARGRKGAFRALISSSRASGDAAEFWPGVVVWEHWEMIEADRKRRGREWRRKQEGKRKGMRGNSCNWRMARPSLTLQRMGIFNRTQVHFGGFPICHHVHLFTSSTVITSFHIR